MLGSGGGYRLPHLSCHCPNCEAARRDPRLRRTTTSVWLRGSAEVLLDAGPDLYQQALREGIERVDAVFVTHAHRDHMLGLECLEPIVRIGQERRPVQVFGPEDFTGWVRAQFGYMIELGFIQVAPLEPGVPFAYGGYRITPFVVDHHDAVTTFGYRVESGRASLVYLPDIKGLPGGELAVEIREPDKEPGAKRIVVEVRWRERPDAPPAPVRLVAWRYRNPAKPEAR